MARQITFDGDIAALQVQLKLLFNKATPTLERLRNRWLDEGKYENIDDYHKVLGKALPGVAIIKMTKRPFGCLVQVHNFPRKIYFRSTATRMGQFGVVAN